MESANRTNALQRAERLSPESLALLLDEVGQYHKTEVNDATTKAWWEDLRGYSTEAIRSAWVEHRRVSSYFPFTSDLRKFLDFKPDYFQEAVSLEPECGCSKEKLMDLKGEPCEHGTVWGIGALKRILGDKIATMPVEQSYEERKAELKAQAEKVK